MPSVYRKLANPGSFGGAALRKRKVALVKRAKMALVQHLFPVGNSDTPMIRLQNFSELWETRTLGDVAKIIGGGTPDTKVPEYWEGEIDWYAPAEIGEEIFVSNSKRRITAKGLANSSAKMLPIGTVLFTSRAGIGSTAILAKEAATNQGFQSVVPKPNILDSYFIFSRTAELKRYAETVGAGSTFVEVSGKQLEKMNIAIPTISEQEAIGVMFQTLDNAILNYDNHISNIEKLKAVLLQQMFT